MFSVTVKVNGKEVKPSELTDIVERKMVEGYIEIVKKTIGLVKCPIHNREASLIIEGRDFASLSISGTQCCPEFDRLIKAKFSK